MGFDNDCILNIQSLSGEYFCAVCRLLVYPNEALQAPCTHLFCKPCLAYVVSTNHACPYDGYRVTEADSKPLVDSNKTLADTIGKIQVHCLYYRTGCTWQGSLSDCTSHCSTCAFGESPVLCNRCGIQLVHRQVQEHAQNCSGVQSQGQQPSATQGAAPTATDQSHATAQTGAPASQGQVSQATSAPATSQVANQPSNLATQTQATQQPQAVQAAVPSVDQWYQQQYQQQYQQYYQQYPGYDPYQQQYHQYYYAYPQGAQPYQQQPMQAYAQTQVQPQVQSQPQAHPHQPPQAPPAAGQPQPQPQAPPAASVPPQAQSQMHVQTSGPLSQTTQYAQPQAQAAPQYAQPQAQTTQQYGQPQAQAAQQYAQPQAQATHQYAQPQAQATQQYAQPQAQVAQAAQATQQYAQPQAQAQAAQPYGQPQQAQTTQPYAQNQQQAKAAQLYTHPQQHGAPHQQMQPPHPHPQAQTQHYPYPQNQAQVQPPPQPNPQAPYPPTQPNQPVQNAVTGFQSYPHQQPPQSQVAGAPQMHPAGVHQQPQYAGQIHGQPPQLRPPQPYPAVPTQHPTMGPPSQQLPAYPHAQQPGYGVPHGPGIQPPQQAVPQQHVQQQSFPGQAPYMQPQVHAHGSSQIQPQSQQNYAAPPGAHPNMAQNYAGRPMVPQGAVAQPYGQAPGLAGAGQVRPNQPNQAYPMKANDHRVASEQPVHPPQSSKIVDGEKPLDQMPEKAVKGDGQSKEIRNMTGVTGLKETTSGNEGKKDVPLESASEVPGSEQGRGIESKLVRDYGQEGHLKSKENAIDGISASAAADDMKEVNSMDSKHAVKGQGRLGVPSMPHGMPHPGNQLRPQGPGQVPPGPPFHAVGDNTPPSAPFDKPGNVGHPQGNVLPHSGHPQNPRSEPFVRPSFPAQRPGAFDSHGVIGGEAFRRTDVTEPRPPYHPLENDKFPPPRMGYFDDRHPDPHFRGPVEGGSHGNFPPVQSGSSKFSGPSGHETMNGPGVHNERFKPFLEEQYKSFPHREFEDDPRKYPRPSHLEPGSSNFGSRFPSSGPLDRGPHMLDSDGPSRPFDKGPRGFERDSGPSRLLPPFHPNDGGSERAAGFPDDNMGRIGRHRFDGLPSRSPGRDYTGFPPRSFGGYRDVDRSESRSFEGSKPYNFPAEPFGKSIHESRFPVPPNHFPMGDHEMLGEGNNNQDMPPSHFRRGEHMGPHGSHLRDGAAFGLPGGLGQMGEPSIGPHVPFGESFGGEKSRHLVGEPGFRSSFAYQHHARDGGFSAGELEPFDNLRKRKVGGNMCLLCQVECGTVEGLDLHAQSRDHQRKAMDIAMNIKQQNKKQQKKTVDQGSGGGGRSGSKSKASFERRGNKR